MADADKSLNRESPAGGASPGGLSHWQRVAVLMVGLGQDLAAELMRQFSDDEVAKITQAIADLKTVPRHLQDEVLAEFQDDLSAGRLPTFGGETFAKGMLEQALGPERAKELWGRMGHQSTAFAALEEADPHQVAPYIGREHPQAIALILTQVSAPQAAAILQHLPARLQSEVAHRIATLDRVSPEVLAEVEAGLAQVLEPVSGGQRPVEGARVAADILNRIGATLERNVLSHMDAADPEIAEQVRSRMFTFDDIARLSEADLRLVLQNVEIKDLLVSMKAAGKGVMDCLLKQMSERRQRQFLEDLEALPRMRLSEVEEVQMRVVQQMRQLEDQGVIRLPHGEDESYI